MSVKGLGDSGARNPIGNAGRGEKENANGFASLNKQENGKRGAPRHCGVKDDGGNEPSFDRAETAGRLKRRAD